MGRMNLYNLVRACLTTLIIVSSISFCGCEKKQDLQKSQSRVEQTDQFLNEVKKLRENPKKSNEYFEIIGKLAVLVKEEVKRNPEGMELFLEDMMEIASKTSPGLALELESYANTALKQEMERLKKESSVAQLLEKERKISALEKQIEQLQLEKEKKILAFEKEIEQLQQEIIRLQETQTTKDEEIKRLNRELHLNTVPVLIANIWSITDAEFKVINKSTKEPWFFLVKNTSGRNSGRLVVSLPPGDYEVECYRRGEQEPYAKSTLTVTKNLSAWYESKQYHGVIETPK